MSNVKSNLKPQYQIELIGHLDFDIYLSFGFCNLRFAVIFGF